MKYFNWIKSTITTNDGAKQSFSQCGEDIFIDFWLEKNVGFYVDVGANHPTHLNNTYMFYQKGWTGINIEPDVAFHKLLKDQRPRDINLNCAIGNKEGMGKIHAFKGATLNTMSHEKKDEYIRTGNVYEGTKSIKQNKLSTILSQHASNVKIDFMSVDVEGLELNVLKSNNWLKFRPTLIVIETVNNKPIYKTNKPIDSYLLAKDYLPFADTYINTIYASREFLEIKGISVTKS